MTVFCRYETRTAQESGSQLQCHAVMSLQFTHVPSAYRSGLRKSRADCSTVGLYCVTMPLQPVVGLGLGGPEARLKRGPSDDVIIIRQP